jgi:PST family polysaccharide transporter
MSSDIANLKEKTLRGGAAKLVGFTARAFIRLGTLMVLAHLLDPSDFGLVAMVTVVTGALEVFASGGLSDATIQRVYVSDAQISTLFWCNVAIGALLGLLCLAAAPFISAFYQEPKTALILAAVAPAFMFNATGVQHLAIMQRELRYVTLATIEVGSEIITACIAIGMALAGFGYWAVVASVITGPIVITLGAWLASGWLPGRPHAIGNVSALLRFGGTITLNNLVVYGGYNSEKVLLGRYFGPDVLGLYSKAYELINLPTRIINMAIAGVAFSSLSRLQHEPARFKDYFLKGYSLVISITLPATIACAVFADDIILITLGSKWTQAATIFRLLAPTVLVYGMINPLSWLLWAVGLQERSLQVALVLAPVVICSYLVGLPYGPNGVALAFSSAMVLWFIPHLLWCLRGTTISVHEILSVAGRVLLCAAVAALAAVSMQDLLTPSSSALARLAWGGTVMFAVYAFALLFVMKQRLFYFSLLRTLRGAS